MTLNVQQVDSYSKPIIVTTRELQSSNSATMRA